MANRTIGRRNQKADANRTNLRPLVKVLSCAAAVSALAACGNDEPLERMGRPLHISESQRHAMENEARWLKARKATKVSRQVSDYLLGRRSKRATAEEAEGGLSLHEAGNELIALCDQFSNRSIVSSSCAQCAEGESLEEGQLVRIGKTVTVIGMNDGGVLFTENGEPRGCTFLSNLEKVTVKIGGHDIEICCPGSDSEKVPVLRVREQVKTRNLQTGDRFTEAERRERREFLDAVESVPFTPEVQDRLEEVSERYSDSITIIPCIENDNLVGFEVEPVTYGGGDTLMWAWVRGYIATGEAPLPPGND